MSMHMSAEPNTAPFARLAKKLDLPENASREDVAEAFFNTTAKLREDVTKGIRKALGTNTLFAAHESRVREPESLARVLDALSGVDSWQAVALAMIGAVEGMKAHRKALAAASFDKKAEVLTDLDRAIGMLSREGLVTTPSATTTASSSASTSTAATAPNAAPRPNAGHASLSRSTVEEARRRGVDPDQVAATLRTILRRGEQS